MLEMQPLLLLRLLLLSPRARPPPRPLPLKPPRLLLLLLLRPVPAAILPVASARPLLGLLLLLGFPAVLRPVAPFLPLLLPPCARAVVRALPLLPLLLLLRVLLMWLLLLLLPRGQAVRGVRGQVHRKHKAVAVVYPRGAHARAVHSALGDQRVRLLRQPLAQEGQPGEGHHGLCGGCVFVCAWGGGRQGGWVGGGGIQLATLPHRATQEHPGCAVDGWR